MSAFDDLESLMGEVWLAPGSPQEQALTSPPFHRKYRLLISGDTSYAFVNEFNGFKKFDDGWFAHIQMRSFPRDSRLLHFRLEERERSDTREWRELATFVVRNPKPSKVQNWEPDRNFQFSLPEGFQLEVGEVVVRRHKPAHPADIWEYTARLPVRITRHGEAVTNWGILEGSVRDAVGNSSHVLSIKTMTNGWMVYRMHMPVDPAKLWKFKLRLGCDSDFPVTNLFSFTLPISMSRPMETNLGGFPIRIRLDPRGASLALNVQLTNKPAGTRLTLVSTLDEEGNSLDDWTGSWGRHGFYKSLKTQKNPTGTNRVHVTVAIHPEHELEFTVRPRDESGTKSDP